METKVFAHLLHYVEGLQRLSGQGRGAVTEKNQALFLGMTIREGKERGRSGKLCYSGAAEDF